MPLPLVIGYHLIWTAYGWWLPNDPRGSMSHCIRNDLVGELGAIHFGRKRIQPASAHIRTFYDSAEPVLKHPALTFDPKEFAVVASAFADAIAAQRYTCYACAIMPDHVHMLIRKHKHAAEEILTHLQRASHLRCREAGIRTVDHPVWGGLGWKVFLDSPDDIWRTNRYVEQNPTKARLPAQQWDFVKEYDGWPLHAGHDPNSPYARRLRGQGCGVVGEERPGGRRCGRSRHDP